MVSNHKVIFLMAGGLLSLGGSTSDPGLGQRRALVNCGLFKTVTLGWQWMGIYTSNEIWRQPASTKI